MSDSASDNAIVFYDSANAFATTTTDHVTSLPQESCERSEGTISYFKYEKRFDYRTTYGY